MKRITCIFNPKAGEGRFGLTPQGLRKRMRRIAGEEGVTVKVETRTTDAVMHCTQLARACGEDGVDIVVAVGGDGTVNEAVNALAGNRDCALGIVPAGSGNDAARSLGLDLKDPDVAIKDILTKEPRPIDLGRMNGRYFIEVTGIGLDAEVSHASQLKRDLVHRIGPTGLYVYSALKVLPRFKPKRLRIEVDGKRPGNFEVAFCTIGNGPTSGGGFKLTPKAKMDDGRLDLTIARWNGLLHALTKIKRTYDGRHLDLPQVDHMRFKKLRIRSLDRSVAYHLDGEIGHGSEFDIEVVPRSLRIVH